jgi:hypothetical protein
MGVFNRLGRLGSVMPKMTIPSKWLVSTNKEVDRWSSMVKMPPPIDNEREKIEMGRVGFEPTTPAMSRR